MEICVVGSAVMDLVFRAERLPQGGETILGGPFASYSGGKGANQAVAIARLEGQVSFIGCVGSDDFGDILRKGLASAGVDVRHLKTITEASSGCAAVVVDANGNNQIVVAPGANMGLSADHVRESLAEVGDGPVLAQLETPEASVEAAAGSGRPFFLNPAPARRVGERLFSRTFATTPNELEVETLVGVKPVDIHSCRLAARELLSMGVHNVVITLGDRGCFWMSANSEAYLPAPSVTAVDTVGAGDAFSGALVLFLSLGRDWPNALSLANHTAALAVTKHGAQASMPTLAELRTFAGALW